MRPVRPDLPFDPSKVPFYYGWVILVASTVGLVMSAPGQTIGVTVFTEPLLDVTGLSRLEFSNAYLMGTLASGLMLPYAGTMIDRFGVRRGAIWASIGMGIVMVFLSQVDHIAGRVAAIGLSQSTVAYTLLTLGFLGLRFSGQGVLTLVCRTMLGRWFERHRGLVSSISSPFASFAFAGSPILLAGWVAHSGWRSAWFELAVVVGVGMSLFAWVFFRETPEASGLRIDGLSAEAVGGTLPAFEAGTATRPGSVDLPGEAPAPTVRDFTRAEAIRTTAFWVVVLGVSNQALVGTGVALHVVDIGAEVGLSETEALKIFLPITLLSVPTGLIVGLLVDRFPARYLIMAMSLGQILMFSGVPRLADPVHYWICLGGWGFASGFYGPLTVAALPNFFGRTHLGAIQGVMMMIIVIASALGPALLAFAQKALGSYSDGLYALVSLPLLCLMLAPWTREPRPRGV